VDNIPYWKKNAEKLKGLIPRQQFDIPIQAAIGVKVVRVKQATNVTAKCVVAISLEKKIVEKTGKGKTACIKWGMLKIPQEAFMADFERMINFFRE
jgi:GTP-binding protein LepA